MTMWLINFKQNGRKLWTAIDAKSIQKACDKLQKDGNIIEILHIEAIENGPIIQEENWTNDKNLL